MRIQFRIANVLYFTAVVSVVVCGYHALDNPEVILIGICVLTGSGLFKLHDVAQGAIGRQALRLGGIISFVAVAILTLDLLMDPRLGRLTPRPRHDHANGHLGTDFVRQH